MEKVQLARAHAARAEAEGAARLQLQQAQQQQQPPPPPPQEQQRQRAHSQSQSPSPPTQTPRVQRSHVDLRHHHHHHSASRPQTPPPYSGPSDPSSSAALETSADDSYPHNGSGGSSGKGFPRYPGLPKIDYRIYSPPLFKLSSDLMTLTSKAEYLSTNAAALVTLVRTQAQVPPKPYIVVKGSRGRKVDFEVKLNLMALLIPEGNGGARMDYIRCVGHDEVAYRGGARPDVLPEVGDGGLDEWCRRFVEDPAGIKTFTLERVVANLDVGWIDGQMRSLLASLKYKGNVDVTFVVTHSKITVQNPDKVNQFFTSVTSLFAGKNRYEVVKSVWPFASARPGEPGRRCAVQTEETWWREWRGPIGYAIAQKRQGWVTVEDKLEAVMEGKGSNMAPVDWGPEFHA
ncbi:hypothetical protein ISF_03450 [Cordyceps fumosorosea ARSEF 2679]|uniref:Uncharacterized protein n=1 Tax=Cordyceps fumosorosea (strain ARSEF 2679) TaxID=1081104 RepID=A0A168AQY6_CORFA|nr:hypothetical protein ISF_03450 [Cordyceps fumosorosea ARSEF 2679]OAA69075.1 hypothetical protein ISF_03450 [Cordyceps fumosorosea ARSEF 2679]